MNVTVVIPVGPYPENQEWLDEAIVSAIQPEVTEILLIDDGANLEPRPDWSQVRVWKTPWNVGVATAFNFGVALAKNELVFMLGSDDWLAPNCIEKCVQAYKDTPEALRGKAYYSVVVKYNEDGAVQTLPCNAAMVTKTLWQQTGGFPLVPSAPDVAFLALVHNVPDFANSIMVGDRQHPLYHHRLHDDQDTLVMRRVTSALGDLRLNGKLTDFPTLVRRYAVALWKERNNHDRPQ